jgi:hypothetical protein
LVDPVRILIDYGEQRCFKDLDLLAWKVVDGTGALTPGQRTFTLPTDTGTFGKVDQANVITPVSATLVPDTGTRNPLVLYSRAYLDMA